MATEVCRTHVGAIDWLSLARSRNSWNQTQDCKTVGRLTAAQRGLCSRNLDVMSSVAHAARLTSVVCQEQFADKRWNCSSILLAPKFSPDLTAGSREQAFVYALSAASLLQSVAKACSSGLVTKCSCGRMFDLASPPPDAGFKWGGCSDNVAYGNEFSRLFADAPWTVKGQKKLSKRALTNLHNNMAGRKIAVDSLSTSCKCHGVSGSCSIKTCWKALPEAHSLGVTVMKSYVVAVEVALNRNRKHKQSSTSTSAATTSDRRLMPATHTGRTNFSADDLIFYTQSPDYCIPEVTLGSLGTADRVCQKDNPGSGGCQSMCCGRGYWTRTVEMQYRCDCKYYWCCYVKCKTCTKTIQVNRCR